MELQPPTNRTGDPSDFRTCIEQSIVKQAILATVVSIEKRSSGSVLVRLQSDGLKDAAEIVSTSLNLERSQKHSGSHPEVICRGDPKAEPGDKVAVVVKPEKQDQDCTPE